MFLQNEYVAMQLNQDARSSALQEAENIRKLYQAGLIRPSRVSKAVRAGAARLGRLMMAVGLRLAQAEASAEPGYASLGSS